jgi:glucose/arabinose dehydrogenase
MKAVRLLCLSLVALLLSLSVRGTSGPTVEAAGITLQQAGSGFTNPLGIANAGDSRLFIVERAGLIRILSGGTTLPTPFLDLTAVVGDAGAEEGLLGLDFHPDYPSTPYFFVHYTNPAGDVVIARYTVSGNPDVANPASGVILLTIPHPTYANHNGGQLAFGPDGYLYAAVGDGGSGGDPSNNAQNINVLLGKILRLDVDQNVNTPPYHGIPPSNPFIGQTPGRDEIWARGLRNPWRFGFDRQTGDLFIADVGQGNIEEIDFQPASSTGGENYGWRIMEGTSCFSPGDPPGCFHASLVPPIAEYAHTGGNCSVTGGYRYRGAVPSFAGTYVFGDFCSGRIWGATPGSPTWPYTELLDTSFFISSFGEDAAGELYLADYFGGTIQRIIPDTDTDGDGWGDSIDNCPSDPNPGQENADRNFVDQTPPSTQDDGTWINSDNLGDICESDDDNDGLSDANEQAGSACGGIVTNTLIRDTDGDLFLDGAECVLGTNPADSSSKPPAIPPGDTDGDGLSSIQESFVGTNPSMPDTDGDGIRDGTEYRNYNSNPLVTNSDGDTCGDAREVASINGDTTVNSADQLLLALEIVRMPPPPKISNMDMTKDGPINAGDQLFLAARFGSCP